MSGSYGENPRTREIGRYVHDYASARKFLGNRKSRNLANNTIVYWSGERHYNLGDQGEAIAVKLHATNIISFLPKGKIILRSGGWRSKTTKQRINEILRPDIQIYSKKGDWYMQVRGVPTDIPFVADMVIDPTGKTVIVDTRRGDVETRMDRGRSISAQMTTPKYPGHQPNPGKRIVHREGDVKVYYSSELKEYEVRRPGETEGYFTNDKQDAIDTAKSIAREKNPPKAKTPGKLYHKYYPAGNSIRVTEKIYNDSLDRDDHAPFREYAWPGGYPLYYYIGKWERGGWHDVEVVSSKTVNNAEGLAEDDIVMDMQVNWEDGELYDSLTGERIESAYAEPEEENPKRRPSDEKGIELRKRCGDTVYTVESAPHDMWMLKANGSALGAPTSYHLAVEGFYALTEGC